MSIDDIILKARGSGVRQVVEVLHDGDYYAFRMKGSSKWDVFWVPERLQEGLR